MDIREKCLNCGSIHDHQSLVNRVIQVDNKLFIKQLCKKIKLESTLRDKLKMSLGELGCFETWEEVDKKVDVLICIILNYLEDMA